MIVVLNSKDGVFLGADENGKLYTGTEVELGDHELTVKTEVAKDGNSFVRTTSYKDQLIAKGTLTKEGFLANAGTQAQVKSLVENDKLAKAEAEDKLWAAEVAIDAHRDSGFRRKLIDWEAK